MEILRRFTFGIRPLWLVLLFVLLLVAAGVYALYPRFSGNGADLQLVGVGATGEFQPAAFIPVSWAGPADPRVGAVARFPLLLAVRNIGTEPVRPDRLVLQLPARYRLSVPGGEVLPRQIVRGDPLVSYVFDLDSPLLEPGRVPSILPGLDTLWIEPLAPSYHCVVVGDSIPEFFPAPVPDPELLSDVRIFYAFEGGTLDGRETGLFEVRLDTQAIRIPPPPATSVSRATVSPAGLLLPDLSELYRTGVRRGFCGEPEDPYELLSTVWETQGGGRIFVLDFGGTPRKYLLDLDRDSIIEYELWDPDADGVFEVGRPTRFPVPAFLVPFPEPVDTLPADTLLADSLRADTTAAPPTAPADTAAAPAPTPPAPRDTATPRTAPARPDTARPRRPRPAAPLGQPVRPPPDTTPPLPRG